MGSSSKWQKGVTKLMSSPSKSSLSEDLNNNKNRFHDNNNNNKNRYHDDDDEDAFEMETYFQRLKTKTNMKQMWHGKKFDEMVSVFC